MSEVKLVDKLTPEQEAEFPSFRDKWGRIGASSERINKEAARESIMKCYDLAPGIHERPKWVVFVESPFQIYYFRPIWDSMAEYFQKVKNDEYLYSDGYDGAKQPEGALWYTTNHDDELWKLRIRAVAKIWDAIIDEIKDTVPDIEFRGDTRAFYRALGSLQQEWLIDLDATVMALRSVAQGEVGHENYGNNEAWLCFYEFLEWCGCEGLDGSYGLQELANHAGWWISYDIVAVVADRPVEIHVDEEFRLHSHTRPSVRFSDGWQHYDSHGMTIPAEFVEKRDEMTADDIDEQDNAELRRVMLEIFGFANYLKECNAVMVDRNPDPHIGTLWRKPMEDDPEDLYMLEMRNSTPEPDGSWKTYVIPVPPHETALEAMAWSYDCPVDEYKPVLQS